MRRPSKVPSHKLSADGQRLVILAQAMALASSRLEERAWERNLDTLVLKLLKSNHQDTIDAALDRLFKVELGAYDALMESLEAASETCRLEHDGARFDALLIAIPILAWTRFSIASGPIPSDMVTTLSAHLHAHTLAADTRMAMAPTLFAIDQLPRTHAATYALTQQMAQAALQGDPVRPLHHAPETAPFLADTRYLLAVVVATESAPLFRWQETEAQFSAVTSRENALAQWRAQAMPNIARLLPGCGIELLLPEAYYVGCREADKKIRPASIHAAVHYLTHTLGVQPNDLHAVIGSFSEEPASGQVDEYRVSFVASASRDVVYGIVWPLYGPEDLEGALSAAMSGDPSAPLDVAEAAMPSGQIVALLRESGITHIDTHAEIFPMESCDDCGAPLFCDLEAELVHAEMPEDAPPGPGHFH